ncbi:hypothetical protein M5689_018392 [Euphorbia peplus]|nr:hypothetical protein M5689_018392 [Euphorbia peplus]
MDIMKMKGSTVIKLVVILAILQVSTCITLCGMNDEGLAACKPSVTQPNPVDPPSPDCCKALTSADLTCLCSYRNSFMLPSLGIDTDLALGLPAKCDLSTPSDC